MRKYYVTWRCSVKNTWLESELFDGDRADVHWAVKIESMQVIDDQNMNRITVDGGAAGTGTGGLVGAAQGQAGRGRGGGVSSTGGVKIQVRKA